MVPDHVIPLRASPLQRRDSVFDASWICETILAHTGEPSSMKDRLIGIAVTIISLFVLSWLTIEYMSPDSYLEFYENLKDDFGFRGAVWGILLPISVPLALRPFGWSIGGQLPFTEGVTVGNPIGDDGYFFLVLGIWCFAAFVGGLSTGRGLGAGWRASRDSSMVLAILFGIMTATIGKDLVWVGVDWIIILAVTFFLAYTLGGLLLAGLLGALFGGLGGVVGKIGFESIGKAQSDESEDKKKKADEDESEDKDEDPAEPLDEPKTESDDEDESEDEDDDPFE